MGICGIKSNNKNNQVIQNTRALSQMNNQMRQNNIIKKEEEKETIEYNDFEEDQGSFFLHNHIGGKMIDEGVKQIPSYKCTIPFDELKELRDKFWQSKIQTSRRWKAIREICESDAATAVQLLEAAGFVCKDNLQKIMELENIDIVYKVPNFCIADPIFERNYNFFKVNKDKIPTKDISIILYCSMTNKETNVTVSNKFSGKELKEIFAKRENFSLDQYHIRLFYSGQEINDDHMLYYYGSLENNSKLQVMCIKKVNNS